MSKYASYVEALNHHEETKRQIEALKVDPEVQRVLDFQEKLLELMEAHNIGKGEILELWGIDTRAALKQEKTGTRASRPLKTYRNPHTGEVVLTRGGNHKVLKVWREEYGKQAVDSWQEA